MSVSVRVRWLRPNRWLPLACLCRALKQACDLLASSGYWIFCFLISVSFRSDP